MSVGSENKTEKCMHILIRAMKKMEKPLNPRCLLWVNDDVIKTGYTKNRVFKER